MDDAVKTRAQLITELQELRQQVAALEALETRRRKAETELEAERRRLFSLLDGLPAIIYLQAKDYSIPYTNRYFLECFGEPKGRPCYEVINNSPEPCPDCRTFCAFGTNQPQKWEWTMLDGRIYQIYDYPFIDIDGTPLVLELGIDISEQKQLEKLRNELLANVSHELRTPLMKIQGHVEALRDSIYTDREEFKRYLDIIYLNTNGLNRLISDLFDLSLLEARQSIQLKKVSLDQVLRQYLEETKIFVERQNLNFRCSIADPLRPVIADPDRLVQVLNNLVENAVKFTPRGGLIQINVKDCPDGVFFEVIDNGRGIPENELPSVFTRFFQSKNGSSTKHSGGAGLGLAIAKAIIEAHRGTIKLESRPGQGSRFFFTIPASE